MKLFKNKNASQIEKHFHKCPVCGEKVQTIPNELHKYNKKYLDGQRKISINDWMAFYHMCPKCGFVYIYNNYDEIKPIDDKIKIFVNSNTYKSIVMDDSLSIEFKKIKLLEQLLNLKTMIGIESNLLFLNYYEEKNNEEKVQEYLLKRIDEISYGLLFAENLYKDETCLKIDGPVKMHNNEVLTDLYRRSGQFDKAMETANFALKTYNFPSNNHPTKKFYELQVKLIEAQDKRHI